MSTESITNSLEDIEINGVIKLLNELNPHKVIRPDNIHASFLEKTSLEVAPALVLIYQPSIHQ